MSKESITPEELKAFIDRTYELEEEYKTLIGAYNHFQDTVENLVEFLPNALWILERDSRVFLQNSKADELSELLAILNLESNDYEVSFKERAYLIKISHHKDKILLSAIDITEQKRKESLATMGQMAAHLSHEIRNPIGSISLLTSTLIKRVKVENKPIVFEIQKAVYRIERIIKATLMFSGGVKTNKSHIKFSQILDSLHSAIGYYSYTKEIEFDFIDDDFEMIADAELLSMLFSNFIFNAIDAIELDENDSGYVKMEYKSDDDFHIFYISDSGIAIENKEKLFEAFESTKEKGNGLGLVLSLDIAQAHGGDVRLLDGDKKCFEIRLQK